MNTKLNYIKKAGKSWGTKDEVCLRGFETFGCACNSCLKELNALYKSYR